MGVINANEMDYLLQHPFFSPKNDFGGETKIRWHKHTLSKLHKSTDDTDSIFVMEKKALQHKLHIPSRAPRT